MRRGGTKLRFSLHIYSYILTYHLGGKQNFLINGLKNIFHSKLKTSLLKGRGEQLKKREKNVYKIDNDLQLSTAFYPLRFFESQMKKLIFCYKITNIQLYSFSRYSWVLLKYYHFEDRLLQGGQEKGEKSFVHIWTML